MAAPETQNPDADNAMLAKRAGVTAHDWITYLMVIGTVCVAIGVPLVLLGDAWGQSTMVLIGAVCFTVSTAVWSCLFVIYTWKAIETARIAVPLLWRRIRR